MLALTIDNSVYGLLLFHSHSLCGDLPSFPLSPGSHGAPSFPGLHSTGTTTVQPAGQASQSAPSLTKSIRLSLSHGTSSDVESWFLSFQIHVHHTPSWSGYLTMSRYVYVLAEFHLSLGVGESPSSQSFHLGIVKFRFLIRGLATVTLAAACHHVVTSPICQSTVSHFHHLPPGFQSSQSLPFAHAGIWKVSS